MKDRPKRTAALSPPGDDETAPLPGSFLVVQGGRIEVDGAPGALRIGSDPQVIGRAPGCALTVADDTVSAVHAEVRATPKGVRLRDMGSRNGTFVGPKGGDARISEAVLSAPCVGRFGARRFRFVPEPAETLVLERPNRFGGLVGSTPEMLALFATLQRYARGELSVVIRGETGTGKERVARAIHESSPRRAGPFVALNCGAIPENLIESELFGVKKGAFTGADHDRPGLFLEADGGTLFFDEVAEMAKALQSKLLRVLEHQEVRPVGGHRTRRVDVRTVFATHADLRLSVNEGRFRQDLYFRIAQINVEIPPLRQRLADLPLLLSDVLADLGRSDVHVDPDALAMLRARPWPGNIRELRTHLQLALEGSRAEGVTLSQALATTRLKDSVARATTYEGARREFDRGYYTELNIKHAGNVSKIAEEAGRERSTVRTLLRALGLRTDVPADQDPKRKPSSAARRARLPAKKR